VTTSTLLGYLARFASFTAQSEVLCTQSLTYLLQAHKEARSALAKIVARTGIEIDDALTWLPEAKQKDGARPDLEARMSDGTPLVKVEAKLEAQLLPEQLQSYVSDLRKRNRGDAALLVLVPESRKDEASGVTCEAFELSGDGPWSVINGHRTGIAVISWQEIFDALRGCKVERLRHEFDELEGMYFELSSEFIAPLASESDLREWRTLDTDFF
jgi:hypothetical protein